MLPALPSGLLWCLFPGTVRLSH